MNRAQTKRAAWACYMTTWRGGNYSYEDAASIMRVPLNEVDGNSPRTLWAWANQMLSNLAMEASMLLSEAHRPDFEMRRVWR